MPGTASGRAPIVTRNAAAEPLRTVLLHGNSSAVSGWSHVERGATVTGSDWMPARIASATWLAARPGMSTPAVAWVSAVACPRSSSPGADVPVIGTATTLACAPASADVVAVSVCPALGSFDRASPNHATIRLPCGRHATASVARRKCAFRKSVCGLPPPPTP